MTDLTLHNFFLTRLRDILRIGCRWRLPINYETLPEDMDVLLEAWVVSGVEVGKEGWSDLPLA